MHFDHEQSIQETPMYQLTFRFRLNDLLSAACLTVPANRSAVAQWYDTKRQLATYLRHRAYTIYTICSFYLPQNKKQNCVDCV